MAQFAEMSRMIREIPKKVRMGTLKRIEEGLLIASGLDQHVGVGDLCMIEGGTRAEITAVSPGEIRLIPFGSVAELSPGLLIWKEASGSLCPDSRWLGRIVNAFGDPLDGQPLNVRITRNPSAPHRNVLARRGLGDRLDTGEPAIDTMLPIVRGQRVGLFAGSGVGKTSLLNSLARGIQADVIVFAMIGERGHELASFLRDVMDPETRARSICVAATADCSALERRRAALTAIDIAEHFKREGRHVLVLMDSLTRWAEAHRQIEAAQSGRMVSVGFPANTAQDLARMMERLGPGATSEGDITAVLSILVAGSDMDEPLADMVRGMLDGHIVLDRDIAERGRFPAIDVLKSVSRSLPQAATKTENETIATVRETLTAAARIAPLRDAGLSSAGADPEADRILRAAAKIDEIWAARDLPDATLSFARLTALVARSG